MAHPGQLGVIFGKGPSLDDWDLPHRPDEIWTTINEACKVIPKPDYAFMADCAVVVPLKDGGWHPDPATIVIGKDLHSKHLNNRDWVECIVGPTGTMLYYSPVPDDVKGGSSPAMMLYIYKLMGIREVVMVGFDAWTDIEQSSWSTKVNAAVPNPRTKHDYRPSNDTISRALRDTGYSPIWWHLEESQVREMWHA